MNQKLNLPLSSLKNKNHSEIRILETGIKEHYKIIEPTHGSLGKSTWTSSPSRGQGDGRDKKNTMFLCRHSGISQLPYKEKCHIWYCNSWKSRGHGFNWRERISKIYARIKQRLKSIPTEEHGNPGDSLVKLPVGEMLLLECQRQSLWKGLWEKHIPWKCVSYNFSIWKSKNISSYPAVFECIIASEMRGKNSREAGLGSSSTFVNPWTSNQFFG